MLANRYRFPNWTIFNLSVTILSMTNASRAIDRLYGSEDLIGRILDALRNAGKDPNKLSRDDLSAFDEFHAGGIDATREIAGFAQIRRGMQVLDLGSGVGGPARTCAAEWACAVTGIDITASFCAAARELSRRVGMDDQVAFVCADAIDMPFSDASFDTVVAQYSLPNIERQGELFVQIARVLKPGGTFVFETLCQGSSGEIILPVFWAETPAMNHIRTPAQMQQDLHAAGFIEIAFENRTEVVLAAARSRLQAARESAGTNVLWLGLIVAQDVTAKMQNSITNNEQGRTLIMRGLFRKSA